MFSQEFIQKIVDGLVLFATDFLLPILALAFAAGCIVRGLIFFTVTRESWFAKEFEKRVHKFLDSNESQQGSHSFFVDTKRILERTYYELFEMRALLKRRNPDFITTLSDRFFLIQHGTAWLVRDSLKQIKYLKHIDGQHPKFLEIVKNIFQSNPCFNRIFGIFPAGRLNDFLNILPGLFIIGGIFGTFLGIMKALPELSGMDLTDVDGTKQVMDTFLLKISFSMSTSIMGILLSVAMQLFNTFFSPEKVFMSTIERYENSLDILWNRSQDNRLPSHIPDFNEHRDPVEALAEDALIRELESKRKADDEDIVYESYIAKQSSLENSEAS